jgi:ferredoxin
LRDGRRQTADGRQKRKDRREKTEEKRPKRKEGEGDIMTWVVTSLCRDKMDMACVEVCPVDCIVKYNGSEDGKWPAQLYIDPDECISCGVCEPECPWDAIYEDEQVPNVFNDDIALNAKIIDTRDDFEVPERPEIDAPTPEEVEENKKKWGFEG